MSCALLWNSQDEINIKGQYSYIKKLFSSWGCNPSWSIKVSIAAQSLQPPCITDCKWSDTTWELRMGVTITTTCEHWAQIYLGMTNSWIAAQTLAWHHNVQYVVLLIKYCSLLSRILCLERYVVVQQCTSLVWKGRIANWLQFAYIRHACINICILSTCGTCILLLVWYCEMAAHKKANRTGGFWVWNRSVPHAKSSTNLAMLATLKTLIVPTVSNQNLVTCGSALLWIKVD